jgi:excisionase family DNA binding protein
MEPILLSREEAARALCLSVSTLDMMINRGLLKARRQGRRVLVPRAEVERVSKQDIPRIWPARSKAAKESAA